MKILGFVGSSRIEGNTDILVRQALSGAAARGAQTNLFHLGKMDIKGCYGCDYCKSNKGCRVNDDMQAIYKEINNSDAIIIGSPIYMMQVSAQTKLLIDRLYAFRNLDSTIKIEPKKLMLIYTCRYPDPDVYKQYYELMDMLYRFLGLFQIKYSLTAGGTINKGDIKNNIKIMELARIYGEKMGEN